LDIPELYPFQNNNLLFLFFVAFVVNMSIMEGLYSLLKKVYSDDKIIYKSIETGKDRWKLGIRILVSPLSSPASQI